LIPLNDENIGENPQFEYGQGSTIDLSAELSHSQTEVPGFGISSQTQPALRGIYKPQSLNQASWKMLISAIVAQFLPQQYLQTHTNSNTQQRYFRHSYSPINPNG
jgi:hypothetical protein